MKKATVVQLKNNLSRYLAYVRRGGRVTVFNRDTPIAEVVPVRPSGPRGSDTDREQLRQLEREGVVRCGTGEFPDDLLEPPPGKPSGVLDALLEERATGR